MCRWHAPTLRHSPAMRSSAEIGRSANARRATTGERPLGRRCRQMITSLRLVVFLGVLTTAALPTASERRKPADGKACFGCCGVETLLPVPRLLRHQLPKSILVVLRGHSYSKSYKHFNYNFERTHANFFSHVVDPWRHQGHSVDVGIVSFQNNRLEEIERIYRPEFIKAVDYTWKNLNETKHRIMIETLKEISARGGEAQWDVISLTRFDLEMRQPITSFAVDFDKLNFGWKEVSNKGWHELPRVSDALQIFPSRYISKYEAAVKAMEYSAGLYSGSDRVTHNNGHMVLAEMEGVDLDREVNFLVGHTCMSKWYLYNPIYRQAVSEQRLPEQAVLPLSPLSPSTKQRAEGKHKPKGSLGLGSCGLDTVVPIPPRLREPTPRKILVVLRGLSYLKEYKAFHYNFERTHENFFSHIVEPWRQQGHSVDVGVVTFESERQHAVQEVYRPELMHVANFSFAWRNVTKHHILLEALHEVAASGGASRWDVIVLIRFDMAMRAPITSFAIDFDKLNFGWREGQDGKGWEQHPLVPNALHIFPSKYLWRYEVAARKMIRDVHSRGSGKGAPNRILVDMEGVDVKTEVNLLLSAACKSNWFLSNPIFREAVFEGQAKQQHPLPEVTSSVQQYQ